MERSYQARPSVHYSSVLVPAEYGYYGNISGVSPNEMYRRYVGWFMGKYGTGKNPLTFKEWLVWARKKNLVLNTDGPEAASVEEVKKAAAGTGKRVAIAILIGLGIYFAINGLAVKNTAPVAA